ncbi:hypothetical protein [Clostridium kluyveri]|uniref:hypothetical protein n=1 Tax=Clostridium kluyveri TaxID=1534 RepID=UPI000325300B|nr:hypothetical protein [Clostridium kluyveri]
MLFLTYSNREIEQLKSRIEEQECVKMSSTKLLKPCIHPGCPKLTEERYCQDCCR